MQYTTAVAFAGFTISVVLSSRLIFLHLKHFTQPKYQLHICRILLMIPIFAIQSFISFCTPHIAIYLDVIRDCYEGYVLHTFMSLLINYLNGEEEIVTHFNALDKIRHPWPLKYIIKPIVCNRLLFWRLKRGVSQFIIIKSITAILSLIIYCWNTFEVGNKDFFQHIRVYIGVLNYISTAIAMYTLIIFYLATREKLSPFSPLSKFICIKIVIFFSFWQSCIISFAVHSNLVHPQLIADERTTALLIQDWLICVELPWLALAHMYTFPPKEFADESYALQPFLNRLSSVLKVNDLFQDAHDSFFKPIEKEYLLKGGAHGWDDGGEGGVRGDEYSVSVKQNDDLRQ